jgi:hypothetical protein
MILIAFITWKTVVTFMFVTLFILLGIIFYKKYLSRMTKDNLNLTDYCVLYSFERSEQTGEIEFYFTNETAKHVVFEILGEDHKVILTLEDKEFKPGGHLILFDSKQLANGVYYYQLRSDNQKTLKRMNVMNL